VAVEHHAVLPIWNSNAANGIAKARIVGIGEAHAV
jgi:hypothetical protein